MTEKIIILYNHGEEAEAMAIMDCGPRKLSTVVSSLCHMAQISHIDVACAVEPVSIVDYDRMIGYLKEERESLLNRRKQEEDKRQLKLF